LYLLGKIRLHHENVEDNSAAIRLLERAIGVDPGFAAAQATLASAYSLRLAFVAPEDGAAVDRAQLAVEKALRLDPGLAEAHYAAGRLLWGAVSNQFAHDRAMAELKRALALDPNVAEAHQFLGTIYLHVGLLGEAEAEFQKTLSLDPTYDDAQRRLGLARIYRGQYEEGLRLLQEVPPRSSESLWHYQMAWALLYLGRNDDAWMLMDRYLRAHPEDRGGVVTSTRAIWFAKAGDATNAEADIRTAIEKGKGFIHFHHTAYNIASAYALLGRAGEAVQWLRETADTGWPCFPYFAGDPNLDNIRSDPGLSALMRQLESQWKRYQDQAVFRSP
jgi:tetratricopeptide (TPR) repeat protein